MVRRTGRQARPTCATGRSSRSGGRGIGAWLALLLALWAMPAGASDGVEFYATVDRDRIAVDETVTLRVTLAFLQNAEPREIVLPETPDFYVLSQGRSEQMSFQFGGGSPQFRKVRTYSLVLQPQREGLLPILPGRLEVKGKRYETGQLTVEVGPPGSGGRQPQAQRQPGGRSGLPGTPGFDDDPLGSLLGGGPQPSESELFVRASVDKTEAWVGEQVTLSVWLLSRVEVSQVESLKMPGLDGFWVEELETPRQISSQTQIVDGIPYRAYLIQRRALFPLRAGELAIDPVSLDVVTGRALFGGGRRQHRASPVATIRVKELPQGPAAASRGNVGHWSIDAEAAPAEVAVGEPVTLRLTATGTGSLRNLELPALPRLDGFKVFDPTRTDRAEIRRRRYGGSREVAWVLVPEKPGTHEIPALSFAFFDPEAGAWQTMETQPLRIAVLPGQGVAAGAPAVQAPAQPGDGGLQPLRTAPLVVVRDVPLHERPWFPVALLAPALAVVILAASPALRRRSAQARRKRQGGAATLPASLGALAAAADPAFFAACERALRDEAGRRLGREVQGVSRDELARALEEAGVPAAARGALLEALARCEAARYAPGGAEADAWARVFTLAEEAVSGLGSQG